jgi:acyl dehydratase
VHARFSRPVALEDTLTFQGVVTEVVGQTVRASVRAKNQRGEEVLKHVSIEGFRPGGLR